MRHARRTTGFVVVLGAVLLLAMAGFGAAAASSGDSPGDVEVSLEQANQTVDVGEEATYDLVVEGATDGIGAYMTTIELGDTSAATVTGFEHAHDPMFDNTEIHDDKVVVSTAMGDNIIEGNETTTLGTVTLAGTAGGETGLNFAGGADEVGVVDAEDNSYNVTGAADATLQVEEVSVDVGLTPADQAVGVDGQTSYDVVVEGPTEGISAYTMMLELDNASVATVEGFEHTHDPMFEDTSVTADSVNVSAALGDSPIEGSEEVVLGTLTVSGQAEGTTDLAFVEESLEIALADDSVSAYSTGTVTDGSLQVTADGEPTTVELVPLGPVVPGEVELGVVVTGADSGISAYDMALSTDSAAATFTDWELSAGTGSEPLDDSQISDNGTSLSLVAALLDAGHEPAEETQIATVTVAVDEPGTHALEFDEATIQDLDGGEYTLLTKDSALSATSLPPVGNAEDPPEDTNGDGLHEDVDGDGSVTIFDVQALFKNLDSPAIQENAPAFSFDGGNQEAVTIFDVQGLFDKVGSL
jgi:hypothetical protein